MSKRRKKKSKTLHDEDSTWFEDSALPQLFLWRIRPRNDCILLAGNQLGYQKLISALSGLSDRRRHISLMCRKPQIVAPAQWRSSPLARKKEAPIEEIEKDLKSTVNGFDGFVWYQGLDVVLTEHAVSNCVWHGNHLKLSVDGESISELCDLLKESTFPMGGWTEIATMRNGNQRLCLAGDWLGAE